MTFFQPKTKEKNCPRQKNFHPLVPHFYPPLMRKFNELKFIVKEKIEKVKILRDVDNYGSPDFGRKLD